MLKESEQSGKGHLEVHRVDKSGGEPKYQKTYNNIFCI